MTAIPQARESNNHDSEYSPRKVTLRVMYIGNRTKRGRNAEARGDGMGFEKNCALCRKFGFSLSSVTLKISPITAGGVPRVR